MIDTTRAGANAVLDFMENRAAECFREDGFAATLSLIFSYRREDGTKSEDLHIAIFPATNFSSVEDKETYADRLKRLAFASDAFAIAMVSEVRTLCLSKEDLRSRPGESAEAAVARWKRENLKNGEFASSPHYKEMVSIRLEHAALPSGGCMSSAEIQRAIPGDEESPGTLLPFVRCFADGEAADAVKFRGRFTHMLPASGGD